jgi:hypothetical protein
VRVEYKSAAKRFDQIKEEEYRINPISSTDILIVNELTSLLHKIGLVQIVPIMGNHKYLSDEEVLEDLKVFSGSIKTAKWKDGEEGDPPMLPYWLHLKNKSRMKIMRFNVVSFSIYEEDGIIGILLNDVGENVSKVPMHYNTVLEYFNVEDRDFDFRLLEESTNY